MKVRTASRSIGGVVISVSSRTPVSASCSVRGIGVADSVSTWTSAFSSFSRSLCLTPKCCSSSTISRPRSRKRDALAEQRMGADDDVDAAVGDASLDRGQFLGADQPRRLGDAHRQAGETRARTCLKCWRASSVVGTTTATWRPASAVMKAARSATSVLPKPTSPQISRSMGVPAARSPITASMAACWSSVSS